MFPGKYYQLDRSSPRGGCESSKSRTAFGEALPMVKSAPYFKTIFLTSHVRLTIHTHMCRILFTMVITYSLTR